MSTHLLPPALWQRIAAFLEAGHTGEVRISVRRGVVTGYAVTASWPVEEDAPESRVVELSTQAVRRVQSPRQ